jgi:hypothetical protein
MIGRELPVETVEQACRVVRALGGHRYVAGKLLLVHTLVDPLGRQLEDPDVDAASRDERLWRPATEADLASVLALFWGEGDASLQARDGLLAHLDRLELPLPEPDPFDESREDDVHPLLIDAGWELLPLAELDPERHRGAMGAYGEPILFESARFEEQEAMPPPTHLYELPAIGPRELLEGAEGGLLTHPLMLYTQGDETYVDYVLRGVLRAAKIT